ncbi:hypothetical protein [uncultured Methanospirillum sp.]|uniref:hypothetical protein n=1 Tax=uncultured Methanospirillum sp. TaxID=262503 RepID=UPI0029C6091D|nr:hypothetical protein [uncultured Methanospirillum sp.]
MDPILEHAVVRVAHQVDPEVVLQPVFMPILRVLIVVIEVLLQLVDASLWAIIHTLHKSVKTVLQQEGPQVHVIPELVLVSDVLPVIHLWVRRVPLDQLRYLFRDHNIPCM